jgi:two-component system response regulator DesR
MFRVLLVEQTNLFRAALAAVLSKEDDLDVVAQLGRITETELIARAVRPDVAVIDIDLLTDENAAIAGRLNEALPDCAILALAGPDLTEAVHEALDSHVRGFVGKDTPPSQLAQYIRQVAAGERVIDPTLAVAALSAPRNPLTAREREILRIAASGVPSAEIGAQLYLSAGTVRNYLSAIMHKTGARNRLEAVRIAEEGGWL